MLKYAEPYARHDLYYWCNLNRSANAEVDYVIERDMKVTPLEVKAGLREEVLGVDSCGGVMVEFLHYIAEGVLVVWGCLRQ